MNSRNSAHSFAAVADQSVAVILSLGGAPYDIAAQYQRNEVVRESGNLVVNLDAFRIGLSDIRIVRLFSNKIDVFTCFAYPDPASIAPTYAMEFVLIGGKPVVAVIDLLLLTPCAATASQLDAAMHHARRAYSAPNHEPVPDWYGHCRSGRDIFSRPHNVAEFAKLEHIHLELFEQVCHWFARHTLPLAQSAQAHCANLDAYKSHHCINSPGLPIMERTFGATWTQNFMQDWVFRLSDRAMA
jgi:hypothetical protein